ncbi:hypothetical protein LOD99_8627 [Oopsacas minuta]|uniref:HAT C-terminal dimerisation domain-containing protein n=1 Tax=Oopsacas minuta TaxID=111878 RepID=A0AAV7JFW0_9METZ|nr:hypothetical protein LOD99_8627 [Oopsacas minuta]
MHPQISRAIEISSSHATKQKQDDGFVSLFKEMRLFETTGTKSENLSFVDQALSSIPARSVEAERAFSAIGLLITNLRSKLSKNSVDTLVVLKAFFKPLEQ